MRPLLASAARIAIVYWAAGFPGIMVTDTAFLRSGHYHSPTDTADTLDYRRLAGVVDGVFSAVVDLANSD